MKMEPTHQEIQELRTNFLKKVEDESVGDAGSFHPADVARVKNGDDWLRRFLLHHDSEQKDALQMLWDTCEWRKKFGTNDITEKNVNMSILEGGSVFAHNRDKDGKLLLIFKSKKHVKGTHDFEELKRCVVYWFERLERLDKGEMISIIFDMDGAGLSNMDMEYTKYLISLFKNYYPYFLNYILIYEMAWVLNAAFKVIKTWLPAKAVQKIKFLNKSNIKEYVEPDQALKSWGGNDDYVFKFIPEQRQPQTQTTTTTDKIEDSKKKVHFADGSPLTETQGQDSRLTITPSDVITFVSEDGELVGSIILTNDESTTVSYKIKTTSPEKFRVRPSTGVLQTNTSVTIHVVLQHGFQLPGLSKDKFLIMSLPVDKNELSAQELSDLWKTQQSSSANIEQHRLRCSLGQSSIPEPVLRNGTVYSSATSEDQQVNKLCSEINKLQNQMSHLREDVKSLQRFQIILIGVVLMLTILTIYLLKFDQSAVTSSQDDVNTGACYTPREQ